MSWSQSPEGRLKVVWQS